MTHVATLQTPRWIHKCVPRFWKWMGSVALALLIGAGSSHAQTFSVLYSFTDGTDGATLYGGLARDNAGNFYGTSVYGGSSAQAGTVFKIDPSGNETTLHIFTGGPDGGNPQSTLLPDGTGGFFGTAAAGANSDCTLSGGFSGCGTVFHLGKNGQFKVLHSFTGGRDGSNPIAGLTRDKQGNLYGVTIGGGKRNCQPVGGCGTIFRLDLAGNFTVLHAFTGGPDGGNPYGGLIVDPAGNLFGTTINGGDSTCKCGVVFRLVGSTETVLHTFTGSDGDKPYGVLVRDSSGNLFGTTYGGGGWNSGEVFKLDKNRVETVLYSFMGGADGGNPIGGLVIDATGNLYGTTYGGGDLSCSGVYEDGCGVVFMVDVNSTETVLHTFAATFQDGIWPYGSLVRDAAGNLYGTTTDAGRGGFGTVFEVTP